ncbi:MAG: trp operon repressor [Legionellales bacterium]|nr:trp operon repressor [Legionellales bacterium]
MDKDGWQGFLELCLAAKDKQILSELFVLLLTAEEKASLESRYHIIKSLLEQKKSQRQIAEDFNVSIATITRGSNELKRISPALREFLINKFLG